MNDKLIQDCVQRIGLAMTKNDDASINRRDKDAIEAAMILLANGIQMVARIADALERSAAAHEGIRPAHDSLDAL